MVAKSSEIKAVLSERRGAFYMSVVGCKSLDQDGTPSSRLGNFINLFTTTLHQSSYSKWLGLGKHPLQKALSPIHWSDGHVA
jgi:hypothetical protein